MKTYNLHMSLLSRLIPFIFLGLFTFAVPFLILIPDGPGFATMPMTLVVAWYWWVVLTLAYRVVIQDDGIVEWVALAKKVKMLPEDIREITPVTGNIGFFKVRHVGGKVRFINQITGFHEVILHIKGRNPMVILKGC
jgi:hypothetical protein